jgi:hypothetical protein
MSSLSTLRRKVIRILVKAKYIFHVLVIPIKVGGTCGTNGGEEERV